MKILNHVAALAFACAIVTPAQAESSDPDTILDEVVSNGPAHGWDDNRAAWVNYAQDRDRRYRWTLNIEYGVTPSGRIVNCTVWTSSGSDQFDNAACAALTKRARIEPKLDANGKAVKSSGSVSYQLYYRGWICGTGLDEAVQDEAPAPPPAPQ